MNTAVLVSMLMAANLLQTGGTLDSSQRLVLRVSVGQALARVTIPDGGTAKFTRLPGNRRGITARLDGDGVIVRLVALSTDAVTGATSAVVLSEQRASGSETVTFYDGDTPVTVQFDGVKLPPAPAAGGPCDGDQCCMSCGGVLWCACRVETACGQCCCSNKCACDSGGGAAPGAGPASRPAGR